MKSDSLVTARSGIPRLSLRGSEYLSCHCEARHFSSVIARLGISHLSLRGSEYLICHCEARNTSPVIARLGIPLLSLRVPLSAGRSNPKVLDCHALSRQAHLDQLDTGETGSLLAMTISTYCGGLKCW